MKKIVYTLLLLIAGAFIWLCIPKSCEPSGKLEHFGAKSAASLKIDSIQSVETLQIRIANDSLISELKTRDSIHKAKIETLSGKYYALRATIKGLKIIHVDSLNQVVEVSADQYNASINSGTMCDSLLMYLDQELAIKDSIISVRDIDVKTLESLTNTKQEANNDLVAFVAELKTELKRAKNQNKGLKIALVIDTLLHLLH